MSKLYSLLKSKYISLPLPVKVAMLYIICKVTEKGIAFFAVPIYTRLMPPEQYGYYSIFQSWEEILLIFATLNMWNYLFSKGMVRYEHEQNQFASALVGLSGLLTILLFIIYLPFNKWFERIGGLPISLMCLMFLYFLFRPSFEYWCAKQRFNYNVGGYVVASIIVAILTPIVCISAILFFKSKGIADLSFALIGGKVICAVAVYVFAMIILLSRCKKLFNWGIWKYALTFNLPLIPHFLSSIILQQSDRIMIGSICGNSEAGIYSVAYSISTIMLIANSAAIDSIIPWMYKKMKNKDYKGISSVGNGVLLFMTAANIIVALFAPEVIALMAPSDYSMAMYIIPPVAISNVFICMFNLFANVEYYFEETQFVMLASILSAVANLILNYIFIKKYGFLAAGYTTMICYIIYSLCHCVFMYIVLNKHNVNSQVYNTKQLWIIALCAVIAALLTMIFYPYLIARLCIAIIIVFIFFINRKRIIKIILDIRNK